MCARIIAVHTATYSKAYVVQGSSCIQAKVGIGLAMGYAYAVAVTTEQVCIQMQYNSCADHGHPLYSTCLS